MTRKKKMQTKELQVFVIAPSNNEDDLQNRAKESGKWESFRLNKGRGAFDGG